MQPNQKISEGIAVLATIDPVLQGIGTVSTGWISVANMLQILALVDVGVFGASATVDANIVQATDNIGTGSKAITGKSIVQMLAAGGNNKQVLINLRPTDLDTTNNFNFVRLNVVVAAAATQVSAAVVAVPRYEDASLLNQAGVTQVI